MLASCEAVRLAWRWTPTTGSCSRSRCSTCTVSASGCTARCCAAPRPCCSRASTPRRCSTPRASSDATLFFGVPTMYAAPGRVDPRRRAGAAPAVRVGIGAAARRSLHEALADRRGRPRARALRHDRDAHERVEPVRRRAARRHRRLRPAGGRRAPRRRRPRARSWCADRTCSPGTGVVTTPPRDAFDDDGWFRTGDVGCVRRRRLPAHRRPHQGAHHLGRLQRLPARGRGRPARRTRAWSRSRSWASRRTSGARSWWRWSSPTTVRSPTPMSSPTRPGARALQAPAAGALRRQPPAQRARARSSATSSDRAAPTEASACSHGTLSRACQDAGHGRPPVHRHPAGPPDDPPSTADHSPVGRVPGWGVHWRSRLRAPGRVRGYPDARAPVALNHPGPTLSFPEPRQGRAEVPRHGHTVGEDGWLEELHDLTQHHRVGLDRRVSEAAGLDVVRAGQLGVFVRHDRVVARRPPRAVARRRAGWKASLRRCSIDDDGTISRHGVSR